MSHYEYGCVQEIICNENNVFPAMRDLIENNGMSVKGAARFVHEDSGGKVTEERARQVYIRRRRGSHEHPGKPLRKHTKEEVKFQLDAVVDAISKGEVVDENLKDDEAPDASYEFRQLWKHILAVSEGLEKWANGSLKPVTEDDVISVKGVMAALPFLCMQAARIGVDLEKIHETFEREKVGFNKK
jgi:hypothetical protein